MGNDRRMFVRRTKHGEEEQGINRHAGDSARGSLYIRMRAEGG